MAIVKLERERGVPARRGGRRTGRRPPPRPKAPAAGRSPPDGRPTAAGARSAAWARRAGAYDRPGSDPSSLGRVSRAGGGGCGALPGRLSPPARLVLRVSGAILWGMMPIAEFPKLGPGAVHLEVGEEAGNGDVVPEPGEEMRGRTSKRVSRLEERLGDTRIQLDRARGRRDELEHVLQRMVDTESTRRDTLKAREQELERQRRRASRCASSSSSGSRRQSSGQASGSADRRGRRGRRRARPALRRGLRADRRGHGPTSSLAGQEGVSAGVSEDLFAPATAAGIHRLAIPTPFAVGRVNVYLIEDEPRT